ncbi:DUF4352 domain-containing protein [Spiractinospora alimapuensis]|uniref:DUF4352 domain-containing protein n=1 Tax=Spiractinospora alimapuensis TaxID=2820884 RepID=UPI001F2BD0A7|nr:DUF4352 domain-containing protein [Spiractinospora alimapuensis]QVQ52061.1 DUF4352 domain-containing protein [Spiractinospora alimapuensis]
MPPGPPPPPQRSTSPILIVILGGVLVVVLVIVAIVLVIGRLGNDEPDPPPPPAGGGGSSEAGIGDTVSTGNLEYTVQFAEAVEVSGESPSGEYVAVTLDVTNTSSSEWTYWSDEQNLYTTDGSAHGYDTGANSALGGSQYDDIAPNETTTVSIVFDVPSAADVSHIGLSEETLGGDEVDVQLLDEVAELSGGSSDSDADSSDEDLVAMGDTATRDPMEFVVTDFETVDVSGATASGEFVAVTVEVTNIGTIQRSFWSDEQNIYLEDGTVQGYAEDAHESNGGSWYDDIGTGSTKEVTIVFDVPSASDVSHIGLSSETYGGNEVYVDLS